MAYWTFYARGPAQVYRHTGAAIRTIRARTGDRRIPIHPIGGIAGHASVAEVRGFARAAHDFGAAGASLYDAPITSAPQWAALERLRRLSAVQPRRPARGSARFIQAMRPLSQPRR